MGQKRIPGATTVPLGLKSNAYWSAKIWHFQLGLVSTREPRT
jgi:hypothetical protein